MAFECFDVAILVEDVKFLPATEAVEILELNTEPTLDVALRQVNRPETGHAPNRDILLDPDATVLDLWINDATGSGYRQLRIGGPGAVVGALLNDSGVNPLEPSGPEDNALILRDLSSAEKKLVAAGLGTTDEYWGDEEGEYEEEIVVTGPEDDYWSPFDDNPVDQPDNDGNPDGDWSGQGGPDESDPSPNPYLTRVTIDESVPPEARERAEQVREKLAAELRDVGEKINSLNDNQIYRYGGREVTGAELKAEFAKIGFNITWDRDYGPQGAGANDNGIVSANLNWLEGKLAENHPWGDWGTNWLILHELAHLLGVVEQFERDMWQAYLDSLDPGEAPNREDWQSTEWFRDHEALTNWFAYLLGLELGLPTGPYPPTGYDPSLGGSGGTPTGGSGGPGPGGYFME